MGNFVLSFSIENIPVLPDARQKFPRNIVGIFVWQLGTPDDVLRNPG